VLKGERGGGGGNPEGWGALEGSLGNQGGELCVLFGLQDCSAVHLKGVPRVCMFHTHDKLSMVRDLNGYRRHAWALKCFNSRIAGALRSLYSSNAWPIN
jgi:hypothetical protein